MRPIGPGAVISLFAELVLFASISPTIASATPWPMFLRDLQHTGRSPVDTSANLGTPKWAFVTDGAVYSSPVIGANDTIFVGSSCVAPDGGCPESHHLYAINPDGTQKWAFSTADAVLSAPAIGADGTVYVGSPNNDKHLYAINPDGTQKWAFAIDASDSPAIGADGTIYVGANNYALYAMNSDGTQRWTFKTNGFVNSSPAISVDGIVYVGSYDNHLYAINPDGTQKWAFATADVVYSSPAIGADGTIYVGCNDGHLYAINPDGTQKWAFATPALGTSPALGADGTIYFGPLDRSLYAINPDGSQRWAFATPSHFYSSPAIGAEGTIYVGSHEQYLYAINPDGTQKWALATGTNVYSSPAIGADGTIYLGSTDGHLYAVGGAPSNTRTPTIPNTTTATPMSTPTTQSTAISTPTQKPTVAGTSAPATATATACANISTSKIIIGKLTTPSGDDTLTFQGQFTLPFPLNRAVNPVATGVRVRIDNTTAAVLDSTIPGRAYSNQSKLGWKVNRSGTKWTFLDHTLTPANGIFEVLVEDKSKVTPGLVKVIVKGKHGSYIVLGANLPLTGLIALDPPAGQCAQAKFPGPPPLPSCAFNKPGSTLMCK